MTTHVTKTWIQDGKLITEIFEEKEIYKREWVGLTDEEIWAMDAYTMAITDQETRWLYRLARAIEAKLKEKNT